MLINGCRNVTLLNAMKIIHAETPISFSKIEMVIEPSGRTTVSSQMSSSILVVG
jgi:hypothetical protein